MAADAVSRGFSTMRQPISKCATADWLARLAPPRRFATRCVLVLALVSFASGASLALPGLPLPGNATGHAAAPAESMRTGSGARGLDVARADSPRGAVAGYLAAARAGDYERAGTYLDLSDLPSEQRAEHGTLLARQFKFVLDRKLWIDIEAISDRPAGDTDDGLPEDRERIGTIVTKHGPVEIRLRQIQEAASGKAVWRFSPRLVERIPALYDEFGPGPLGERMPPALYQPRFLEIELWQWLGLLMVAALAYCGAFGLTRGLFALVHLRARRQGRPLDSRLVDTVRLQILLVVALGLFLLLTLLTLHLSIPAQRVVLRISEVFIVLLLTWAFVQLTDHFWTRTRERLQREDRRSAVALAVLGGRLTKAALAALGVIVVLQQLGFNATGLLTGLGVGGVAVALAAQKTIANLFGGFSLATDQPVRIGDFCRFGDKSGWVEDVGMRSTRIRTLDRSIITVPNSEFAEVQLENMSMRDRIRLVATLGLRYETTPDQLRYVLLELRRLLAADARVIRDPLRVRFVGFGAHSLDIEVATYIGTADFDEFLAIREELFLKMMDIVSGAGTGFAFPSQTVYTAPDTGMDRERAAYAEQSARAHAAQGGGAPASNTDTKVL
jgi:MscS family membrane protein